MGGAVGSGDQPSVIGRLPDPFGIRLGLILAFCNQVFRSQAIRSQAVRSVYRRVTCVGHALLLVPALEIV